MLDGIDEVAVKFLKPEASQQEGSIKKFIAEIDILQACRDTRIVSFLGAYTQNVGDCKQTNISLLSFLPQDEHAMQKHRLGLYTYVEGDYWPVAIS